MNVDYSFVPSRELEILPFYLSYNINSNHFSRLGQKKGLQCSWLIEKEVAPNGDQRLTLTLINHITNTY